MVSKKLKQYIERIQRLNDLLVQEKTGSIDDLAEKLHVSKRAVSYYFSDYKSLGADIKYDKLRKTYYIENGFTLKVCFDVIISDKRMVN